MCEDSTKGSIVRKSALILLALASPVLAEGGAAPGIPWWWWLAPVGAVAGLVAAKKLYDSVMQHDEGDEKMIEIAQAVRDGAYAYLKQQYVVVGIVFVLLFALLFWLSFGLGYQSKFAPFAFITGGFYSALCGFLGMKTATNASARTTAAARTSLNDALQIALRAGAVMGLVVVGFGLMDICFWFLLLYKGVALAHYPAMSLETVSITMLAAAMGASTQALFARVGGGIFTKSADVGADLVGKVEAGIPEDDPRNPATVADNVGDNVGDVAGMGADLYESNYASILSTAALGVAAAAGDPALQMRLLAAPMVLAGVGIVLSIWGVYSVRSAERAEQKQLMRALEGGVLRASGGILIASLLIAGLLVGRWGIFGSIATGLIVGLLIGRATDYYTSDEYGPTRYLAKQAETGPATVIIEGTAVGMQSTAIPVTLVAIGVLLAYGFAGGFGAGEHAVAWGLYGIGIAAVGMLSTLGVTLATDAYGPIADNAGGNAEMTGQQPKVRERTDALDSLGNTTAATGKGFAIGSAALTALALLASYLEQVRAMLDRVAAKVGDGVVQSFSHGARVVAENGHAWIELSHERVPVASAKLVHFLELYQIHLMNPRTLSGMLLGSMAAFFFCSLTMRAVGRAAGSMVEEVRRQFRENPGIMEHTVKPDYARCVRISTVAAQKEMLAPSLFAIALPILVGLVLGVPGVMGLLLSGLCTGFVLAVFMANAGGAWDNAKKHIEKGHMGGKGSDSHKAGVVGDTVGDPYKDTSGPSLNILIKLMTIVSVVFAGVTVAIGPVIARLLGLS